MHELVAQTRIKFGMHAAVKRSVENTARFGGATSYRSALLRIVKLIGDNFGTETIFGAEQETQTVGETTSEFHDYLLKGNII